MSKIVFGVVWVVFGGDLGDCWERLVVYIYSGFRGGCSRFYGGCLRR